MRSSRNPARTRLGTRLGRRKTRGAVMAEMVLVTPLIMVVLVLILYFGWNMRRLARVTNMDRYVVWKQTTPGSPGPAGVSELNDAFFGDNSDQASELDPQDRSSRTAVPDAHIELLEELADESYSYYDLLLDDNPTGIYGRISVQHEQFSPLLERIMGDSLRNPTGHRRLNGDWRFADGVRYNTSKSKWEPNGRRISPGPSLRDIFFIDLDEELASSSENGNPLAEATRDFYTVYPGYLGPDIPTRRENGRWVY